VFQQVVDKACPVLLDDVSQEAGWQQVSWLPLDRSWLGVPLISKGRVIGMISLTRREAGAFSADDATLASAFAGQAAIALENASLYDEISRFNEQLEQMVQERTEELDKAYQNLERLDKTKSDFIEVAAHELRTPLTLIKGHAQLLANILQGHAEARPLLDGILSGQSRLNEIITSMLDVSKIDSQALDMSKERMRLSDVVGAVQAGFKPIVQERQLALSVIGLDDLPVIQADPRLLYKVFYHLIVNAIKYTPDGGEICVSGKSIAETPEGPMVEITVRDTGIGIDPAHQELIFEKFYQTGRVSFHSSGKTKFKGGGPGLGLSIVRGIIHAHTGRIWVESEGYDEKACPGSAFHVLLPVSSVEKRPGIPGY
jgi:signal transduction histidine kinase